MSLGLGSSSNPDVRFNVSGIFLIEIMLATPENSRLRVLRGSSTAADERAAVGELRQQISMPERELAVFFCSSKYDLAKLAAELRNTFPGTMIGCTTAGQLSEKGFLKEGITMASLAGDLAATPYLIDLDNWERDLLAISSEVAAAKRANEQCRLFGLLLIDGLACMEERIVAELYRYLPQVPIVGGSAGDDLKFQATHVFARGEFHSRRAVFTLFRTKLPFATFKFEHFASDGQSLVVTESNPHRRVIYELNGEPAAEVYAATLGLTVDQLNSQVFSRHPLVLEMGGEVFIRSLQKVHPDGSLALYCAIENGVVLSLGQPVDPIGVAKAAFQRIKVKVGQPALIIGCDCILRRLEFEQTGLAIPINQLMTENGVIGFSTYGEQYDGIHVNQTFTGIAIGGGT